MSSYPSPCKWLDELATEQGAVAWGVAVAEPVEPQAIDAYRQWIAAGNHGAMQYLERYDDVRSDPRLLLDGAKSVISFAFPYQLISQDSPLRIASYALGDDYHTVLRQRLTPIAAYIAEHLDADARICVDTAPILERYWAVKAGVGFVGRHHQLIVPGHGANVLLAEIITTAALPPSDPCTLTCGDCMACVNACPGGALRQCGTFDARRCLSYLTIEYRDEFPPTTDLRGHFYGCDDCLAACPHTRRDSAPSLPEFAPRPELLQLTPDEVLAMSHDRYCQLLRHSSIRRATLPQLQRNALPQKKLTNINK